jgi:hypothetical protein
MMVTMSVSFVCCDAVLSDRDFPTFRWKFLLPSPEKKIDAASISEMLVNV